MKEKLGEARDKLPSIRLSKKEDGEEDEEEAPGFGQRVGGFSRRRNR